MGGLLWIINTKIERQMPMARGASGVVCFIPSHNKQKKGKGPKAPPILGFVYLSIYHLLAHIHRTTLLPPHRIR